MPGIPTEALPPQNLEAAPFDQAKTRVEKCQRIGNDLKPKEDATPYSRERVKELRDVEARSQQGEAGKTSGSEELIIDSRGYEERRFNMIYRSDTGEEITEELVMFFILAKDGHTQWLTLDGQPLALNGSLYDSRLESSLHASGRENRVSMIPRVGGRGEYTGVVSIIEARQSVESQGGPQADQTAQANTARQDSILAQPISPNDAREALTELAGREVERNEYDIAAQTIQPVLDKIQKSGQMGRLGIEVIFTPEELAQIDRLLSGAHSKLALSPELRQLGDIIDQYKGDKAFGISLGFGTAILEDSSVNAPTVIQTNAGLNIKVPPDTYRLYRLKGKVGSAQSLLQQPNIARGTLAGNFGRLMQAALEVYKI